MSFTASRSLLLLLLVISLQATLSQVTDNFDDADDIDDVDNTEAENTEEAEYYQPGSATKDCICVPSSQCEDGQIVTDGSFAITARKKHKEIPLGIKGEVKLCGPYDVCCKDPEAVTVKPYEHHCGARHAGGVNGRIVSSNQVDEAEFGEWPWQAIVLRKEGDEYVLKCGGTLIDDTHVLTVAHCAEKFLDNPTNMKIRLGEWDTQNKDELMPHEDFDVSEIIIHPNYNKKNFENDVALLILTEAVLFKPHIDSVCLPKSDDDFTGHNCVVTGFGMDAYDEGKFSVIMKEISVPVLDHKDCQNKLRKTRLGKYFKLFSGFLCAGGQKGVDACVGDGGGPLVCFNSDDTYTLAGLVAWGVECGREGIPGVYMDVRKYVDWITSETGRPVEDYLSTEE